MNTSDVLNRAADLIEERGWMQGEGWGSDDEPSELCLEGGLLAAQGIEPGAMLSSSAVRWEFKTCPAYVAVQSYLDRRGSLFSWNDRSCRTAAEVIEVLRAAALIEAAREAQEAAWETCAELVAS